MDARLEEWEFLGTLVIDSERSQKENEYSLIVIEAIAHMFFAPTLVHIV